MRQDKSRFSVCENRLRDAASAGWEQKEGRLVEARDRAPPWLARASFDHESTTQEGTGEHGFLRGHPCDIPAEHWAGKQLIPCDFIRLVEFQ